MKWQSAIGVISAAAALGFAHQTRAQDDEALDRTPQSCVSVARIRDTDIIDDRTIIFHMRGGRVYRNFLDRECHDLEREGRFAYQARGGRLCKIDTITVLTGFSGFSPPGMTCQLGEFHPITKEEADLSQFEADEADVNRNVVLTPIELPQDEGETGAAPAEPEAEPEAAEPE